MISTHLPILLVIIPLLAAPLCLLINHKKLNWLFTLLVSAVSFVIAVQLLLFVSSTGPVSYHLGGWLPPYGIEIHIDQLNAFVALIITAISTLVLLSAYTSLENKNDISPGVNTYFYVAYLLCFAGLLGILVTGDAFNLFVFLEISSLASYVLIALGKDKRALWASFQYLVMGTIGATFILIGIGLMYMKTGTLNMADLAVRLPEMADTRTVFVAFCFFVVGVCLKMAVFPLHMWLPNAYAYAPTVVTAFLAASATKVALYVVVRFVFLVFGVEFSFTIVPLQAVFVTLGALGVLVASLVAINQKNIKRMLAYSSVAQIGYMVLGLSIGSAMGLMATLLHLFNHALMKGALFLSLGALFYRIGGVSLKHLQGVGKEMPFTMAAFVIGGLSIIGMPLTVGFVSKWYLLQAALEQSWYMVSLIILVGSLLSVIYIWKVVEAAYFKPAMAERAPVKEAPLSLLVPIWILVLANVYFGIDTSFSVTTTQQIAQQLLHGVTP